MSRPSHPAPSPTAGEWPRDSPEFVLRPPPPAHVGTELFQAQGCPTSIPRTVVAVSTCGTSSTSVCFPAFKMARATTAKSVANHSPARSLHLGSGEVLETNPRMADAVRGRVQRDNKRKCPVCARTFSKTEHLERHVRSHTKEKPFQCQHCGRKYGRKYVVSSLVAPGTDFRSDSLLRHLKDAHSGPWDTEIGDSSGAPKGGLRTMGHALDGHPMTRATRTAHEAALDIPTLDDLGSISVAVYPDPIHQTNSFQATSGGVSTWGSSAELATNIFSESHQTSIYPDNWLLYGNLDDSLLRDWPFVIDNADLGCTRLESTYSNGKPVADLQQSWYTYLDRADPIVSGDTTPVPRQNQDVDDDYRQSLHRRLQIRVPDETLPSAEYLNLCMKKYFLRFHPVFPIVHTPTFRPSKTNAVLLLSICSIGSLLTGHPGAVPRGIRLFERLNKAILSNWESLTRGGPDASFAMVQASFIGQTFGLLSGQAKHLLIVDTFHGVLIAWARRMKLFHLQHQPYSHEDVESNWREWVRTEERIRLGMALYVHDAEIASTLHHEILLPSRSRRTPSSDADVLFNVQTPQEWIAQYRDRTSLLATPASETSSRSGAAETPYERLLSIPINCHFSVYAALEEILASVVQVRIDDMLDNKFIENLHSCLLTFRSQYGHQSSPARQSEPLQGGNIVLCHLIWISLHADIDLLERAVGRDGPNLDPTDLAKVHGWARSDNARRAVAHSIMIRKSLEHFPLTSEPALHVPRSLFSSAICLFCYVKYGDSEEAQQQLDFPEFQQLNVSVTSLLREARGSKPRPDEQLGTMYGFVDLLQRIGHWEISRKFASILGTVIHAEAD